MQSNLFVVYLTYRDEEVNQPSKLIASFVTTFQVETDTIYYAFMMEVRLPIWGMTYILSDCESETC